MVCAPLVLAVALDAVLLEAVNLQHQVQKKMDFFGDSLIIFLDPSCVDTGLVGFNLCYNGTTNENLGQCCPDYYTGSTQVYCLPTEDTPATQDRYKDITAKK